MDYKELVANGTIKEPTDRFFECERVSIDTLLNKRVEILACTNDVETKQGKGRMVVKVNDNGKVCKFFTNCKFIKEVLTQVPDTAYPLTTTIIVEVNDGRRHYKLS